jgi:hypothetical protein
MSDPSDDLAIFLLELPDANEELAYQYPITFHLFPKLPDEVKLMIWRRTFPRRTHVLFGGPPYGKSCVRVRHTPPSPISSRVNFESRQETLRHYKVLQTGRCACNKHRPEFLFWNGETDRLRGLEHRYKNYNLPYLWNSHFNHSLTDFSTSVRILELTVDSFNPALKVLKLEMEFCNGAEFWRFNGLKELRILDSGDRMTVGLRASGWIMPDKVRLGGPAGTAFIKFHENFFREHAAKHPECATPKVSIQKV